MSHVTTQLIEWVCTLLSLVGSWLCIKRRASGFVVFLAADLGWFYTAWMNSHPSLLAQQAIYVLLNLVGYAMWRQDERLRWGFKTIQASGDFESFPDDHHPNLLFPRAAV